MIDENAASSYPEWVTEGISSDFKLLVIPAAMPRAESGFPLLNSTIALAERLARTGWMAYVNSDVVLPGNFGKLGGFGGEEGRVFSGSRMDCDVRLEEIMGVKNAKVFDEVKRFHCRFHGWGGKDFFVFKKGFFDSIALKIPDFRLGKPIWDNWLVHALNPWLVDVSPYLLGLHLNHRATWELDRDNHDTRYNAYLTSCTPQQKELYHSGSPFGSHWQAYLCFKKMSLYNVRYHLCPTGVGQDAILADMPPKGLHVYENQIMASVEWRRHSFYLDVDSFAWAKVLACEVNVTTNGTAAIAVAPAA